MPNFLNPIEISLERIFRNQFTIPVYQRPYNWGKEQVVELLNDIHEVFQYYLAHGKDSEDIDSVLFIGTIFIMPTQRISEDQYIYDVVDGQQRLTTITLLFMALLNHLYLAKDNKEYIWIIKELLWKDNTQKSAVLELGQKDDNALRSLFSHLYSGNDALSYAIERLNDPDNIIERSIFNNFRLITDYIKRYQTTNDIVDYIRFILTNIKSITIQIETKSEKLFTIFESINSKGKHLEEIDLIKSYIFQNLNPIDYDEYLQKWGKLIRSTEDRLAEYLTIFIRANIVFFKEDVKLSKFKAFTENEFQQYYERTSREDTLKDFINDLLNNVIHYKRLTNFNELSHANISDKSRSFFMMNFIAGYRHTEPILFKLLTLYPDFIDKESFDELTSYAFRFMLSYKTIGGRESRETMKVISNVFTVLNDPNPIKRNKKFINTTETDKIIDILQKSNISLFPQNDDLRSKIKNLQAVKGGSNDTLKIILSYIEALDEDNNVDYRKLNLFLALYRLFKIRFILPESPEKSNAKYNYYKIGNLIGLKKDQDFMNDRPRTSVPAEDFLKRYIYRFANLQLWWNDPTDERKQTIRLSSRLEYHTNAEVERRQDILVSKLIDSDLLIRPSSYRSIVLPIEKLVERDITSSNYASFKTVSYKPIRFTLKGKKYELSDKTWKCLALTILKTLYTSDEKQMRILASYGFYRDKTDKILSNNQGIVKEPIRLIDSLNIFISGTAISNGASVKNLSFEILKEFGLKKSDLIIYTVEKGSRR